ncbi:MAG TPA: DMT family transporter [Gemmatimonadaceae bacterium]|nr:DMT family transporter [Gemmatimonadaceae bacterium]
MLLVLLAAIIGISMAAPLVRVSHATPLVIATWRLFFSVVVIAAILIPRRGWTQWKRLDRRGIALALGAGVMLALHFWSWTASVDMTSIAASVVLVNIQPVIVALISVVWLHEAPSGRQWLGIALAMAGACVVAWGDARFAASAQGARAVLGDALALGGGVAAALYYLVGRRLRKTLDLWPYVALVYGACFVVLLGICLVTRAPLLPQPSREIAIFVALAAGPMLVGHTGLNWALKYLPAYVVNVTALGEPVGATLIAALVPSIREVPSAYTLVGGTFVLGGVLLAVLRTAIVPKQTAVRDAA